MFSRIQKVSKEEFIKKCVNAIYRDEEVNVNKYAKTYVISKRCKLSGVEVRASKEGFYGICQEIYKKLNEIYGDYDNIYLDAEGRKNWVIRICPIRYR